MKQATARQIAQLDYTSFGSPIATRTWSASSFRFGFNGKEIDNEGMGGGSSTYDYGFRIYNPNLGRFLSVDPLIDKFLWLTPYQFAENAPIDGIDLDGLETYKVILYRNGDKVCAKISLITASGPLTIIYYSANMKPANYNDPIPNGYTETKIKESSTWETIAEQNASLFLNDWHNKNVFINDPNNRLIDEKKEEKKVVDKNKKKPKTVTFRGHTLNKGAQFKEKWTPFFSPTSPPSTNPGASNYKPGEISTEGAKFFKELVSKLKGLSGVSSIEIEIKIDVGGTSDLNYFNNTTSKNIIENVEKIFKKQGIKVKVIVIPVRNNTDAGTTIKIL